MKIEIPKHIDLSHPERYILTFAIEKEKIGFSIYSPIENGSFFYYAPKKFPTANLLSGFQEMLFDNEFLTLPFRKVYALNRTEAFTFVPSILFKEEDIPSYMDFLFDKNEKVLHHALPFYDFTTLHSIDKELYGFLQRSYVTLTFIHHSAPILSYIKLRLKTVNANKMLINVTDEGIDMFCFSRDTFVLGNHFSCKEESDAVYYILYTWKQLSFDQTKDFFYITGHLERRKNIMEALKDYVHHIIPLNIIPEAHFEQIEVGNVPFELTSLTLCEL